jgi:hypothetical protein
MADLRGILTLAWRVQLIGSCCTHIDHQQLSYYSFILDAQHKLLNVVESAWSAFDDDDKPSCRVCGRMLISKTPIAPLCKDPQCLEMWPFFEQVTNPVDASVEQRMKNLIDHFFAEKTDFVLPLITYICHNPFCRRALKKPENLCGKCHAAVFCSKECKEKYHPQCSISYLDIFV